MPVPSGSCSEIPFLWLLSTGYHILFWSPQSVWSLVFWEWEIGIKSHSSMSIYSSISSLSGSICPTVENVSSAMCIIGLFVKKKKAADCRSLDLYVGAQFYFINQYVCFDANVMLVFPCNAIVKLKIWGADTTAIFFNCLVFFSIWLSWVFSIWNLRCFFSICKELHFGILLRISLNL